MPIVKALLAAVALCLCLGVVLGFAGRVHPALDTLSLVRPVAALICLLAVVLPVTRRMRWALLASAIAGISTTAPLFLPGNDGGTLRVYSKNLWYRNNQLAALADDIRESDADVVMLQEVSDRNNTILAALADTYPHQHLCRPSGWSGIAVLSRVPLAGVVCSDRRALAAGRIMHDGRAVWVASVHLPWPYPYENARAADAAYDRLVEMEDAPVVMAGDFNIFPWAASVKSMQRAGGTRLAQPLRPTFSLDDVPLFLDHIHAPGGGTASYRPLLGSDHLGVLADVLLDG